MRDREIKEALQRFAITQFNLLQWESLGGDGSPALRTTVSEETWPIVRLGLVQLGLPQLAPVDADGRRVVTIRAYALPKLAKLGLEAALPFAANRSPQTPRGR